MTKIVITLDVDAIRELSNYAHWIPSAHGFTKKYLDKKYPGWEWNDLIPKMMKRDIIHKEARPGDIQLWQGLWLQPGIKHIIASKSGSRVDFQVILTDKLDA